MNKAAAEYDDVELHQALLQDAESHAMYKQFERDIQLAIARSLTPAEARENVQAMERVHAKLKMPSAEHVQIEPSFRVDMKWDELQLEADTEARCSGDGAGMQWRCGMATCRPSAATSQACAE